MDYKGCSLRRTPYPHLGPQQLWASSSGMGIFRRAMAIKSVTYEESAVSQGIDHFLNTSIKAMYSEGYRGRRTPYPQNGQQTLGATRVHESCTVENRQTPRIIRATPGYSAEKPAFGRFLNKILKAPFCKGYSAKRTSYPQKRQQTLGATAVQKSTRGFSHHGKNAIKNADLA